jgi:hypothetical protein
MTRTGSITFLGSEFDNFLFAPIGEDGNKTLLSVVSALARLDLDPWQEAASLARLPVEAAIQRLAALIAALPDVPSVYRDPRTIAIRLIALLPQPVRPDIRSPQTMRGFSAATRSRTLVYMILMGLVLGVLTIMANRQSSETVDDPHAPAAGTVSPPIQPPNSDR